MSFLSPMVLAGLAALGIPVAIHLLNKFRVRTTAWGAMRFLHEVVQTSQRRVQFDDLLLLILRCLLVAVAVCAFARPVLKGPGGSGSTSGPIAAAILLDNSASMGQTGGALNRFEMAKSSIRDWLAGIDAQSQVALYLVSNRPTPLVGKPAGDFGLLRKALDDAALSDDGSDLVQGVQLAAQSLKSITGRPKEIRIYTDGQAATLLHHDALKKLALDYPDVVIRPILIGGKGEDNLGIVTLHAEDGIASVGQPCRFRIEVINSGASTATELKINLMLDGTTPAGTATIPLIGSGETQGVTIPVSFATPGPHCITASIPLDGFSADNQRTAAVEVIRRMDVVIAQSEAGEQGGFFISRALVPIAPEQASHYYLAPQFMLPAELPAALSLPPENRPAVVFLCDPGPLLPTVTSALNAYVKDGGNLVIFPGSHSDVSTWSDDPAFTQLLPATLGPIIETKANQPLTWQSRGFSHPITAFWNDAANGDLATVTFNRYFPLTLKPGASANVIAALSGGQPAVVESSYAKGTVLLFNASCSPEWTNLPLHPAFVPFVQRLMGFLNRNSASRLILAPGETFRLPVAAALRGKDFSVKRPGNDAARTAGQVTGDDTGAYIRYTATERAGTYHITVDAEPVASFAVQIDASESDLRTADASLFDDLANVPHAASQGPAMLVILKEYWTSLLGCLLIIFVVEAALAHRISFAR